MNRSFIRGCILSLIFIFSCNRKTQQPTSDLSYLPKDAQFLTQINSWNTFKSKLQEVDILNYVQTEFINKKSLQNLTDLLSLNTEREVLIGLYNKGRKEQDFLAVTSVKKQYLELPFTLEETENYEQCIIKTYRSMTKSLYSIEINDKLLISSSRIIIEESCRAADTWPSDEKLDKLFNSADKKVDFNLYYKSDKSLKTLKKNPLESLKNLWIGLDFSITNNRVQAIGAAWPLDERTNFYSKYLNQKPSVFKSLQSTPKNIINVKNYAYPESTNEAATDFGIQELSLTQTKSGNGLYVYGNNFISFSNIISDNSKLEQDYLGREILKLKDDIPSLDFLKAYGYSADFNFSCTLDNGYFFSDKKAVVQEFIKLNKTEDTFEKELLYKSIRTQFFSESHLNNISVNGDYSSSLQLKAEDYYHILNLSIQKNILKKKEVEITPVVNLSVSNAIISRPQFVSNHYTKNAEIVFQDEDYHLQRLTIDGSQVHKKITLDGPLQSKVYEVDRFKNNKYQLAFCTDKSLYLIDRKGKNVAPFPISIKGLPLKNLAVFDYDNNRNYRFFVTQNNQLRVYDAQGKKVKGFNYNQSNSSIQSEVKHHRLKNKDYLVFALNNGELKVLHRNGKQRIKINKVFNFSNNPIEVYQDKFTFTDQEGILHQIDTKGQHSQLDFEKSEFHFFDARKDYKVFLDNHRAHINNTKNILLPVGIYDRPQLFKVKGNSFVFFLNSSNSEIYAYDREGIKIEGFPIIGQSLIDLKDIDKDKKLEFITLDDQKTLSIYRME
ncbi:MAG: hypothetical protein CMC18_01310 [Flavobacteriaceae bacterium]|nr:hypothetical protein [Flavobacteriaceae bacterium]